MRDRLIELLNKKYDHFCDQCGVNKDSHYTESLADYLLENGVFVPPCKVNDTVYVILNGRIHKSTVYNLTIETEENHYLVLLKVKVFDQISMFKVFIFGKTAFLTEEGAKRVLKGGAE